MSDNSQNNKRIAKNTFFLYIRMVLMMLIGFFTTRVLLEKLGENDFGIYNTVAAFVAMLGFLNTAMSNGIQRFINFEFGRGDVAKAIKYISNSIAVQLCIAGALLLLFETVGIWFLSNKLNIDETDMFAAKTVFHLSVMTLVLNVVTTTFNAVIIAKEKMDFYAYISIVEIIAQLAIAYLISVSPSNRLVIYATLLLVLTLLLSIIKIIYSKKIQPAIKIIPSIDRVHFKELFSFSGWNLFGAASGTIKSQGINILMNIFFGVKVNAARGIAFQVLSGVQKFTSNFQVAINPQITQSYSSNDRERYLALTYTSAKISFYLMWVMTLPILFSIDAVLKIWLGENIPEYTNIFVIVILLTGLIDSLGSSISASFYATGRIKKYQITVSTITIMVLPISYFLYKLGCPPVTSMYVSLVLSIFAQIARVLIWCNTIKASAFVYLKQIVIPALVIVVVTSGMMYFINELFNGQNASLLILNFIISFILNVVCIFFIGINSEERAFILKKLKLKKL